jgi:hypothetical protein
MVTGRRPFTGDTPSEILRKQLHSLPEQPKYLRTNMPPRLNDLIMQMLEKEPERRLPSAQAVERELERVKVQLGLAGRTPDIQVRQWQRRWQDYLPLAIGLVLLLGIGYLFYRSLDRGDWSEGLGSQRTVNRPLEARNELRRARLNLRDQRYELALDRCRIVLEHFADQPEPVAEAEQLVAEIEAAQEGAEAPMQGTPSDADGKPTPEAPQAQPSSETGATPE